MKSDRRTTLRLSEIRPPVLSQEMGALLRLLNQPVAVCDLRGNVLEANAAFVEAFEGAHVRGQNLEELLQLALPELEDGVQREVAGVRALGQAVRLKLSRTENCLLAVLVSQTPSVEQVLLQLGREVASATSEEEWVAVVARGLKTLFPGRHFCVRIVSPATGQLTSLYAEGPLKPDMRERLCLMRDWANRLHLDVESLPADRVTWTDGAAPLMFENSVSGTGWPLVASGQLYGTLHVEHPEKNVWDESRDQHLLMDLATHVAVGVRNAKLIDELTFVRKYLEELLEHANALILVVNRERRIVVFNKALADATGYSREEVLGREVTQFLPAQEHRGILRVLASSLKGEMVANFETRMVSKSGQVVRASFATSSVLTAQGDIEGVIAIGQDLTRIKELESRVIQAEKLASLGQLAASVVHEINNPMTAVLTYADALLTRSLGQPNVNESDVAKFRKIVENSQRVLRFTQDLVSYARPAEDEPAPTQLKDVIEQAVGFCDHVLKKHHVQAECQLTELPPLLAVRGKLVQVFINLITNACHAMAQGGTLRIETSQDGLQARIRVTDNGCGMAPEIQKRMFEPFFTTKVDGRGTGLGLAIVASIIERHGGSIDVESEVGRGTSFLLRLPLGDLNAQV